MVRKPSSNLVGLLYQGAMIETRISEDPDERFAVAKKIVERAADYGIPTCDVVVDCRRG